MKQLKLKIGDRVKLNLSYLRNRIGTVQVIYQDSSWAPYHIVFPKTRTAAEYEGCFDLSDIKSKETKLKTVPKSSAKKTIGVR